jgi:mannosyl-3-phosphoglycerate phosphatase
MDVLFTDLDGTLLDHDTYGWEPAREALDHLRRQGIPWMFVTSKTRAETEVWRQRLDNRHPFIVENGGAAFVPAGYFAQTIPGAKRVDGYEVLEWGTPYEELVQVLESAAENSGCRVRGFHAMSPEEVAAECDLPLGDALLAKQREYDEPFVLLDPERGEALGAAIAALGCRWTRGGRFRHIMGANDKALAVEAVAALFAASGAVVRTIGLGDGLNDASFLSRVDVPVLIRSRQIAELQARAPRGSATEHPGPTGWNEAVLSLTR